MVDLDAPIIPGVNAGGIAVGSRIESVLSEAGDYFSSAPMAPHSHRRTPDWLARYIPPSMLATVYRSAAIDLWVRHGIVEQVGVHDGYRGKLLGVIGVGSTVAELEAKIGPWSENDEGNLVIDGLTGLCFEVDALPSGAPDRGIQQARIARFFVFAAQQ